MPIDARIEQHHQPHRRRRRRRRLCFSPNTVAGFALAGGGTSFSVANGGIGRSDLFQAGAFVRHTAGAAYVTGALAYGWQDVTTDRTVTIAGVDRLRAHSTPTRSPAGSRAAIALSAPWIGGVGITPYAAASSPRSTCRPTPSKSSPAPTPSPWPTVSRSVTATRSELGLRADKSFAANGVLTLRGRVAWAHDFNPDRAMGATFQTLPGASFVVNGARQATEAALVTASVEVKLANGWSTPRPSKASSRTSPAAMPARASCDTPGEPAEAALTRSNRSPAVCDLFSQPGAAMFLRRIRPSPACATRRGFDAGFFEP